MTDIKTKQPIIHDNVDRKRYPFRVFIEGYKFLDETQLQSLLTKKMAVYGLIEGEVALFSMYNLSAEIEPKFPAVNRDKYPICLFVDDYEFKNKLPEASRTLINDMVHRGDAIYKQGTTHKILYTTRSICDELEYNLNLAVKDYCNSCTNQANYHANARTNAVTIK